MLVSACAAKLVDLHACKDDDIAHMAVSGPNSTMDFAKGLALSFGEGDPVMCYAGFWIDADHLVDLLLNSTHKEGRMMFGYAADILRHCSASHDFVGRFLRLSDRNITFSDWIIFGLGGAERHAKLKEIKALSAEKHHYCAGFETGVLLQRLLVEEQRYGAANSTAVKELLHGFFDGLTLPVDDECLSDTRLLLPEALGDVRGGLKGLLKALRPLLEDVLECAKPFYAEPDHGKKQILWALSHPSELNDVFAEALKEKKLDFGLEGASLLLAAHVKEWRRVGEEAGKLVSEILSTPPATVTV